MLRPLAKSTCHHMLSHKCPHPFLSNYLTLSYLVYLSKRGQLKEYSSVGMKKNYVLYSKNYCLRMEVRLLMKVESVTLSELTDAQRRLLPLTMHHPAEQTSEAQQGGVHALVGSSCHCEQRK